MIQYFRDRWRWWVEDRAIAKLKRRSLRREVLPLHPAARISWLVLRRNLEKWFPDVMDSEIMWQIPGRDTGYAQFCHRGLWSNYGEELPL